MKIRSYRIMVQSVYTRVKSVVYLYMITYLYMWVHVKKSEYILLTHHTKKCR